MLNEDFQRLLGTLATLLPVQLVALEAAVGARMAVVATQIAGVPASAREPVAGTLAGPGPIPVPPVAASITAIEARFSQAPTCPHCQSTSIKKWGWANAMRRYRCKACHVTFNALTGTPLAQLHKRELWGEHAQALVDGISLRKVATRLDVGLRTAFRWRHRFLKAPKAMKPKVLEGTVEADETYFLHSEKGSHHLARPARKRGGKAAKRGLSHEQSLPRRRPGFPF